MRATVQGLWFRETFGHDIPDEALKIVDNVLDTSVRHGEEDVRELLHEITPALRIRHIPRDDGKPYMTRYAIHGWMPEDGEDKKYPLSIYLHHFHTPDYDPSPHNHPWDWARSFVLTGGYTERRLNTVTGQEQIFHARAGDLNRIEPDTYHVIDRLHGETWTLFSTGPKRASWGFWIDGRGSVPWRERLRERGLQPEY